MTSARPRCRFFRAERAFTAAMPSGTDGHAPSQSLARGVVLPRPEPSGASRAHAATRANGTSRRQHRAVRRCRQTRRRPGDPRPTRMASAGRAVPRPGPAPILAVPTRQLASWQRRARFAGRTGPEPSWPEESGLRPGVVQLLGSLHEAPVFFSQGSPCGWPATCAPARLAACMPKRTRQCEVLAEALDAMVHSGQVIDAATIAEYTLPDEGQHRR
jgi:hypothetical protein